ncbi:glycosyltransferase [Flavobacterium sp. KACC 22758]|uniref:glycosyltransferase n=1 Tax=Flavobacterium sp. KACC 22758 TaxID=3025667 RepID=UPI00236508B7|nr:glycosyltransferase [Flavobacterium sp. KACC 22758]WDF59112.1 glycosyltransferase [Flavobacterium sp. KACC 22758]
MNKMADNILAIVVIYNKELLKSETLISLGDDCEHERITLDLFIYDNSNLKQKTDQLKGFNIVEHFYNGKNLGVSTAYNKGVEFARSRNKKWVLLLDQDTFFQKGSLKEYLNNIVCDADINLFSPIIKLKNGLIFSPFKKVFKRGIRLRKVEPIRYLLSDFSPVNSGMLVKISSFVEAGGYNDKVKLDFSDIEFIKRFSKINKEFKVINTLCIQDFSNDEVNIENLNVRFAFFCDGVKNCHREFFFEDFQYFVIVLIRMTMLILKTKSFSFMKTFYKSYIKKK